jgi:hypothetical protein
MFKSFQLIFILILINVIIIDQVDNQILTPIRRSWLYPCSEGQCSEPIRKCIEKNCSGEEQCINCVEKDSYTCRICVNEIFNKLNLVKGDLICSINDPLQERVCQIYCRGKYQDGGKCERNQNQIPRCQCQNKETTTEKITEMPTTTVEYEKETKCKYERVLNVTSNSFNYKLLKN